MARNTDQPDGVFIAAVRGPRGSVRLPQPVPLTQRRLQHVSAHGYTAVGVFVREWGLDFVEEWRPVSSLVPTVSGGSEACGRPPLRGGPAELGAPGLRQPEGPTGRRTDGVPDPGAGTRRLCKPLKWAWTHLHMWTARA